ncbi:MAG: DNA topoisomerase IV subunit A [Planctomycetota bacterium]|nr:DNA topoisomerase IV subunit A [Planctomycetota bacterium]MDA1139496.1 DNA topoisomerase IV subunit A [Planctomycetota bacterium]
MAKKTNNSEDRTARVLDKLAEMGNQAIRDIDRNRSPKLSIPVRSLSNVSFNKRRSIIELGSSKQDRTFFNVGMAKKFMQTYLVAQACKQLLDEGKTTSIRDLYYMVKHTIGDSKVNTVDEQAESDACLEDLEVTIDTLREELNLFASNRGAMVGKVTLVDSGDTIDCRRMGSGGYSIPSIVEPDVIQFVEIDADFVLLVEKDAVWRRLNEDKFWKDYNCVLLHGGGQPSRGVRRMVHRLAMEAKLDVFVLTDNDPWGYYIYSVIKQGSINLAYESIRMAVPGARFIGLSAGDKEQFDLPSDDKLRLNKTDVIRAKQIKNYPWFQKKHWQDEINLMLKNEMKYEIEALSSKGISFITEVYLPHKFANPKEMLD